MNQTAAAQLAALATDMWEDLVARVPYYALKVGRPVTFIPAATLEQAQEVAAEAAERRKRLDAIDANGLSRSDRLTAAHLRHRLEDDTNAPLVWWTTFAVTPYAVGLLLAGQIVQVFGPLPLASEAERTLYTSLLRDLVNLVEALKTRTEAQAERGWRIPRPALPGVRMALERMGEALVAGVTPSTERLPEGAARASIVAIIETELKPVLASTLAAVGPKYEAEAPEGVGMSQYPGGADAYRAAIRRHLGYFASPEEIHATGLAEVARLAEAMAKLRAEAFGWNGDEGSFHEHLRSDQRAKAASPEALEAIYQGHLERMAPVFERVVGQGPKGRPRLARLPTAVEAGMTFGYYDPPRMPGEDGTYYYSGYGLADRLQLNAAPIIFHELVPGHHVHIARQSENSTLPHIRRLTADVSAFNEGWAEYSSGIGEEEGLYDNPYDLYGWLTHQRFIAQRLVVDTGLNAFGWSLEQARDYMSANTLEAPTQVASETLRYSTDLPGQALAYRLGFLKFRQLRDKARSRLGKAFDSRAYHEAILSEGALPLGVLEQSVDEWIEAQKSEA